MLGNGRGPECWALPTGNLTQGQQPERKGSNIVESGCCESSLALSGYVAAQVECGLLNWDRKEVVSRDIYSLAVSTCPSVRSDA